MHVKKQTTGPGWNVKSLFFSHTKQQQVKKSVSISLFYADFSTRAQENAANLKKKNFTNWFFPAQLRWKRRTDENKMRQNTMEIQLIRKTNINVIFPSCFQRCFRWFEVRLRFLIMTFNHLFFCNNWNRGLT